MKRGAGENKYLYNGKELNDDFGLGLHDYGARYYDAAIGRFTTTDRFAEKYYPMTPYQYGANNPIKFIDVNGDSLKLNFMNTGAYFGFNKIILHTLGSDYHAGVSSNGIVTWSLKSGTNPDDLSKEQRAFYDAMTEVMESSVLTEVNVWNGHKGITIGRLYGLGGNEASPIAAPSDIDIADMAAFGYTNTEEMRTPTAAGKLTHEIYEKFHRASKGSSWFGAHPVAMNKESLVIGAEREDVDSKSSMGLSVQRYHDRKNKRSIEMNLFTRPQPVKFEYKRIPYVPVPK